jgi:hypothetical protein
VKLDVTLSPLNRGLCVASTAVVSDVGLRALYQRRGGSSGRDYTRDSYRMLEAATTNA